MDPYILFVINKVEKVAKTAKNVFTIFTIFTIPIICDVICIHVPNFMKIGEKIVFWSQTQNGVGKCFISPTYSAF